MEFPNSSTQICSLTFHGIFFSFLRLSFLGYASVNIFENGIQIDELALLAFKSAIFEDPKGVFDSWNETSPICQWTGVTCGHKHQRVTALDLGSMRLAGFIPPHVGNLSFLRVLDLSDNSFHNVIPYELGQLIRLQTLNLSYNLLVGEVPSTLARCESLWNLILDHNFLEKHIPPELGSLTKLEMLYLKNNNLTGTIPASIGNLTSLQELYISYNNLEGQVPDTMAKLRSLTMLGMSWNRLSGEFPPAFYNISSLKLIALSFNNFNGSLRSDIGLVFPNLQRLYLSTNNFHGSIPASLSNCSELLQLDIPENNFTGNVPLSFGQLGNLLWLNVHINQLGTGASDDLNFISSLTNCTNLEFLDIAFNNFGGTLPSSITNISTSITRLLVGENKIYGRIPDEISNLLNLEMLSIKQTLISGYIPENIGKLSNLQNIHLESNRLSGHIPYSLGNIKGLLYLYLQDNNLEGNIPPSLGNCTLLQTLDLSTNKLTGGIPKEILMLPSLSGILNMSRNSLNGPLPDEVGNLTNLAALDLSNNRLSGTIPSSLGNCLSVESLYMQRNSFEGSIPALVNLKNIQFLDLSYNNLSGQIPQSMAKLSSLLYLDLSFNNLEGEVPVEGVFKNASSINLSGNGILCGDIEGLHLHPCPMQASKKAKERTTLKVILVIVIVASCLTLLMLVLLFFWLRSRKNKPRPASSSELKYSKVSYEDLLKATGGFSSHNLIGSGNFGTVYKGTLGRNKIVAIKVVNLQQKGATKSFLAECQALRNIRHRNLVKILTVCSTVDYNRKDFKALIYDYMPNGNLEKWLHPSDNNVSHNSLSILQRLNIAVDVASALHYLHNLSQIPVVHCDLKPSNVLLGDNLTAHVSDFGLARLLIHSSEFGELNQFSSLGIKGTIGYAPPEYGMGSPVSMQGDVYSFGVLLLETFTGRRPTDEIFKDNTSLHSFVQHALPDQAMDIVDQSALYEQDLHDEKKTFQSTGANWRDLIQDCLIAIFRIGVTCSKQAPQERLNMRQVAAHLISIRDKFH